MDDIQNVQHYQDPESLIFLKAMADVPRKFGVDKGFVVMTPSGLRLFSMTCHSSGTAEPARDGTLFPGEGWDGHGLTRQGRLDQAAVAADPKLGGLHHALKLYREIPRQERLLPDGWRPGLRQRRDLPLDFAETDLVLRMTSRRLPADGLRPDTPHPSEAGQLWRWNQDWLIFSATEARRFLAPSDGATAVVPDDLVKRLARYCVDSTGGQAAKRKPEDIAEAQLHSTLVGSANGISSVRLEGTLRSPSFAGRVFGYAQYHRERERFVAFQLCAVGSGDKGQPLGYIFVLSRGPLERSYPPLDLIPFDDARSKPRQEAAPTRPARLRPSLTRPADPVVEDWSQRLLARLRRELGSRRGPTFTLPSLGGVEATVDALDEHGLLSLRIASGGRMQTPWRSLKDPDYRNLALALRKEFDADDHCLAGFYLLLTGEVQRAEQELSKAGAAGENVRGLFADRAP